MAKQLILFDKSRTEAWVLENGQGNVVYIVGGQPGDPSNIYLGTRKIGEVNAVTSVAGRTGAVTLSTTDISGLGAAALKGVVETLNSSENLPTSGAVKTYVDNAVKTVDGDITLIGTVNASTQDITFNTDFLPQAEQPANFTYKDLLNANTDEYPWMRTGLTLFVSTAGILVEDEWDEGGEPQTKSEAVEAGDQIIVIGWDPGEHPNWSPMYIQRNIDKATSTILGIVKVPTENGLSIDNSGSVKVALGTASTVGTVKVPSVNGLSVDNTGSVGLAVATQSSAGAMSATDKTNLDNINTNFSSKADKVSNATNGNFAGLDANGNLTDSGHKHSDYKTKQTAKADPASGGDTTAFTFIDTLSQDANGEITATKKAIPTVGTSNNGLMTPTLLDALYWQNES